LENNCQEKFSTLFRLFDEYLFPDRRAGLASQKNWGSRRPSTYRAKAFKGWVFAIIIEEVVEKGWEFSLVSKSETKLTLPVRSLSPWVRTAQC